MRHLLLAFAIVGAAVLASPAQEVKKPTKPAKKIVPKQRKADPSKKMPITLKVGDPAPALKATKWLQGEEVKKFEPNKVYVVEFWATWCGPCIVMMPHLAELQEQYKDKGVTVIGYTANGRNNDEKRVVEFVNKRGPKLGYTFAYADSRDSYNDWMQAAGRGGIPCTFVVDKSSRIAYIGHPMYLDVVLPKVVAGTWKGKTSVDEVAKIEKETEAMFSKLRGDPEEALEAIAEFEGKHQELTQIPYFVAPKLNAMIKVGKMEQAKKLASSVVKKAEKYDDVMALRSVSMAVQTSKDKDLLGLAVRSAEKVVDLSGDKDAMALINLAGTYHAIGDKAKAKAFAQKAVDAASSATGRLKELIEKRAELYQK